MKIAPKSAEAYLAGSPAHRAVLLYGPDSGLALERARRLAGMMLPKGHDPLALVELTQAQLLADPALLSDELSAISMMASRRVLLIRDGGDRLAKIIEGAAVSFNDSVLLIVCADALPARSSLRLWFEKEPAAACIACYHDEAWNVQALIRKALDAAGVRAGRDTAEYLSQQLGNDRGVTMQELEKLITYAGDGKALTLEDVRLLVDYNRETDFDDLVAAVADRNLPALEKTLSLLLREGAQPVAYLRLLQRYFNRLYYIRARMSEGKSAEEVIQGLKPPVFFKQLPALTRHAQSWTLDQAVKALKLLVAAELACKTTDLPPIPASTRRLLQVTQVKQ